MIRSGPIKSMTPTNLRRQIRSRLYKNPCYNVLFFGIYKFAVTVFFYLVDFLRRAAAYFERPVVRRIRFVWQHYATASLRWTRELFARGKSDVKKYRTTNSANRPPLPCIRSSDRSYTAVRPSVTGAHNIIMPLRLL